jgi:hypothetical protein
MTLADCVAEGRIEDYSARRRAHVQFSRRRLRLRGPCGKLTAIRTEPKHPVSRRCALLSWILLAACTDDAAKVDDSGAEPAAELFPCDDFPGDPRFEVEGAIEGYLLVPWYDPANDDAGIVVLDSDGCSRLSFDVPSFVTAARWDGDAIWYNQMGNVGAIHRYDMRTGEATTIDAPDAHHDFVLHPDGTVAWLAEVVETVDGEEVAGDVIRERAPDGTVREVWNAFEDLEVTQHSAWDVNRPHAWTHANGIAYDPASDSYLVSLYYLHQILEVERLTGRHTRMLSADGLADEFGPQHAPSPRPGGGVRMFDNAGAGNPSRLLEMGWDGEVLWQWRSEDELSAQVLGDMHVTSTGMVIGSFGVAGVVLAVVDNEEAWRATSPGVAIGRLDWRAELPE